MRLVSVVVFYVLINTKKGRFQIALESALNHLCEIII